MLASVPRLARTRCFGGGHPLPSARRKKLFRAFNRVANPTDAIPDLLFKPNQVIVGALHRRILSNHLSLRRFADPQILFRPNTPNDAFAPA